MRVPHRVTGPGRLLLAVLCLVLTAPLKAAEAMPAAPDVQVALLLKVLTYDRSFQYKARSAVSIGVVFVPGNPDSVKAKDEVLKTLEELASHITIKNLPIRYAAIEYRDPQSLEKAVRAGGVNVFYVAPGNGQSLTALLRLSRTYAITTATGVPDYVAKGIAIGIGVKAGNKPDILINLAASRSEGSEFDAALLRVATLVK